LPLTTVVARVEMGVLLKAAVEKERLRVDAEEGDCEGAEVEPPPSTFVSPLSSPCPSPLSTPPSSPSSSPCLPPSELKLSVPNLSLASMPYAEALPTAARSSTHPAALEAGSKKRKQKEGKKNRQFKKRKAEQEEKGPFLYIMSRSLAQKWGKPQILKVGYAVSHLPRSQGAFVGVHQPSEKSTLWTL
jgi:hypothetical protein